MKTAYLFLTIFLAGGFSLEAAHALTITFDNGATFSSQFPSSSYSIGGTNSTVSLQPSGTPDHVQLYAQMASGDSGNAQVSIYTDSSLSPDMDFISAPKVFTFNNAALSFNSPGSTYIGNFGVTATAGGPMQQNSGPDNSVFFRINRTAQQLQLMMKLNDAPTTLMTWAITDNDYTFSTLSLTLSATTWEASGISTSGGTVVSGSGTFATAWDASTWGTEFYIGMQAYQSTTSDVRYAQLDIDSIMINPVPEPTASAFLMGLAGLALIARGRK